MIAIIENHDSIGFSFIQKYFSEGWPTPCSYNYEQHFDFYKDGSFRPVVGSLGRGCGIDGTYRTVTRIAFAGTEHAFQTWSNNQWTNWTQEQWALENELTSYHNENIFCRIQSNKKPFLLIEANRGQFGDGGRGDMAYYYIPKYHQDKDEGEGDLPTIGPCCNTDFHQGPEKFIESAPQSLDETQLVLWYVPQMSNDNRKGKDYSWAESVLENGVYVAKTYPSFFGSKFHVIHCNK